MTETQIPDDLISEREAQKILNVTRLTMYRWRKKIPPQFKTFKLGRKWCVSKAEIMKFANVNKKEDC